MIQNVPINTVKANPNNPRIIKDDKFAKLVKSINEFPQMLKLRPIVVNDDMIVLGGNMRLKACKEAGLKEIPIIKASELTEQQQKEFIVKDNVGYGEWDWDDLANNWDVDELTEWGLDIPGFELDNSDTEIDEDKYTKKVEAPIYEPNNEKPKYQELYNKDKFNNLVDKIESSSLDKEDKEFLKLAATRHIVFNYQKIADFYANSDKNIQELMEESALIIIDFEKAIELGYVKLSEEILDQYINEYDNE
jgi:hypothetical protein